MSRILRSDFYRLFRSPVFYSVPAVLAVSLILSLFGGREAVAPSELGGILSDTKSMLSAVIFIAVDIVAVYLWNSEHKHGYIKNIAGIVSGRQIPSLSKMTVGIVICLAYTIASMLYVIITGLFFGGITIDQVPVSGPLTELLLMVLAGFASVAIMLLLYELFHSTTACYITAIVLWTGMLENIIVQLAYLAFKWEKTPRYLLIDGLIWENAGTYEDVIRTLLYIAVCIAGAVFVARKQDVRA